MNIHKHGHEAVIEHECLVFQFKPIIENGLVKDLHRLSVSDNTGVRFMWLQCSPIDMNNMVALENNMVANDVVVYILEIMAQLEEKLRFSDSQVLKYAHKLTNRVNI